MLKKIHHHLLTYKLYNFFWNMLLTFDFRRNPSDLTPLQIKKLLTFKPNVILEAGSHNGLDTLRLSINFRKSTVYAFEPDEVNFEKLQKNTHRYVNILPFNYALGEENKKDVSFYKANNAGLSSSLLREKNHSIEYPSIKFEESKIDMINPDSFFRKNNLKMPDFAWLDLQGYEIILLKSSPILLDSLKAVYIELTDNLYDSGISIEEQINFLITSGFSLEWRGELIKGNTNALFCRK